MDNEPDLLHVHKEMPSIGPATNVVVEVVESGVKELMKQLILVKKTVMTDREQMRGTDGPKCREGSPSDLTAMEKFANYAEMRINQVFFQIEEMQEHFKRVLTYLSEDPAMTSSYFFGTLNKFVAAIDSALEDAKMTEVREKKSASRHATRMAARLQTAAKKDGM